jgi:hypothetical protein
MNDYFGEDFSWSKVILIGIIFLFLMFIVGYIIGVLL